MDGRRCSHPFCAYRWPADFTPDATDSDFCALRWGCIRVTEWRAVLPELVKKEDLPAASALNGIEFNFARAIGPGLAGLVIASAGVGTAFLLNTLSFAGVIVVVARWRIASHKRTTPSETVIGA